MLNKINKKYEFGKQKNLLHKYNSEYLVYMFLSDIHNL